MAGGITDDQHYQNNIETISEKEVTFCPEDCANGDETEPTHSVYRTEMRWHGGKTHKDDFQKSGLKIRKKQKKQAEKNYGMYMQICSDGINETNKKNLVLVHGLTSKGATWKNITKTFARMGWRVITPDLPNHGNSGRLEGVKSLHDYSEELYGALKDLGIDECLVVTSSWGTFPAQALAQDHPNFVKGLYLSGPQFSLRDIPVGKYYKILRPIAPLVLPVNFPWLVKTIQGTFRSKTPQEKAAYLKSNIYSMDNDVFLETIDATYKFRPGIYKRIPFALQFADKDSLSVQDKVLKYLDLSKEDKLEVYKIKDSGHHIQQEKPYGFASAVWDFAQIIGYSPKISEDSQSILNHEPDQYKRLEMHKSGKRPVSKSRTV